MTACFPDKRVHRPVIAALPLPEVVAQEARYDNVERCRCREAQGENVLRNQVNTSRLELVVIPRTAYFLTNSSKL